VEPFRRVQTRWGDVALPDVSRHPFRYSAALPLERLLLVQAAGGEALLVRVSARPFYENVKDGEEGEQR
jgi:hypothetical protein